MSSISHRRVAVVTGGGSGIGQAIAARMRNDDYEVLIVGRSHDRITAAAERLGPGALPLCGDVSVRKDVETIAEAVRERFGRVDVLVNNAGLLETIPPGTPLDRAEEIFDRVVGASLKGAFLMAQALIPMITTPGGRIVNIGSIVAHSGGSVPGYTAYTPAKAGQHGLTMALARELGPKGITVNTVAPGFIEETGMTSGFDVERVGQIAAQIPLQRPGKGEDVANAVAWLVSAHADYVTGMTLPVNGGWRFY